MFEGRNRKRVALQIEAPKDREFYNVTVGIWQERKFHLSKDTQNTRWIAPFQRIITLPNCKLGGSPVRYK